MLQDGDIRLRPLRCPDDVVLALGWYADPEVLRFSEGEGTPPYDAQSIERMYRWMVSAGEAYIVEVSIDGGWLPIGDALLSADSLPIVIGDARFRSRGIGKRVLRLLIDRARSLGWARLRVGKVFTYNLRSRRLFEGQGFALCGQGVDDAGREFWIFETNPPNVGGVSQNRAGWGVPEPGLEGLSGSSCSSAVKTDRQKFTLGRKSTNTQNIPRRDQTSASPKPVAAQAMQPPRVVLRF